ncbi:MAG: hypothetical protein IK000_03690 [Bacteroidaceae bacterium]|nr:hypothetical protein [Bacteroidaceae bacterium]
MKKLLVLCVGFFCLSSGWAQDVKRFEVEFPFGMTGNGFNDFIGFSMGCEARLNSQKSPVDVGLQVSAAGTIWETFDYEPGALIWEGLVSSKVYVDYNFHQQYDDAFFAGVGVGVADFMQDYYPDTRKHTLRPVLAPRVGAEAYHHLRLTMECQLLPSAPDFFLISVGVVLGGGLKKN